MRYTVGFSFLLATHGIIAGTTAEGGCTFGAADRLSSVFVHGSQRSCFQSEDNEAIQLQRRDAAGEPADRPSSDSRHQESKSSSQQEARRGPLQGSPPHKRQRLDGAAKVIPSGTRSHEKPGWIASSGFKSVSPSPGVAPRWGPAHNPGDPTKPSVVNNLHSTPKIASPRRNEQSRDRRGHVVRAQNGPAQVPAINRVRQSPAVGGSPPRLSPIRPVAANTKDLDMPPIPIKRYTPASKLGPADLSNVPLRARQTTSGIKPVTMRPSPYLMQTGSQRPGSVITPAAATLREENISGKQTMVARLDGKRVASTDVEAQATPIDMNPQSWPGYDHWRTAGRSSSQPSIRPSLFQAPIDMNPKSWPGYGHWLSLKDLPSIPTGNVVSSQSTSKTSQLKHTDNSLVSQASLSRLDTFQQIMPQRAGAASVHPALPAQTRSESQQIQSQPLSSTLRQPPLDNRIQSPDPPIDLTLMTSSEESSSRKSSQQKTPSRESSSSSSKRNTSHDTPQSSIPSLKPFTRSPSVTSPGRSMLKSSSVEDLETAVVSRYSPVQRQEPVSQPDPVAEALRAAGWHDPNRRLSLPPRDPRISKFRLVMAPLQQPILQYAQPASPTAESSSIGRHPGQVVQTGAWNGLRTDSPVHSISGLERARSESPFTKFLQEWIDDVDLLSPAPSQKRDLTSRVSGLSGSDEELDDDSPSLVARGENNRPRTTTSPKKLAKDGSRQADRAAPPTKASPPQRPRIDIPSFAVANSQAVSKSKGTTTSDALNWATKRQRTGGKDSENTAAKRLKSTWSGSIDDVLDRQPFSQRRKASTSMATLSKKSQSNGVSAPGPMSISQQLKAAPPEPKAKHRSQPVRQEKPATKPPEPNARSQITHNSGVPSLPSSLISLSSTDSETQRRKSRPSRGEEVTSSRDARVLRGSSPALLRQPSVGSKPKKANWRPSRSPSVPVQASIAGQNPMGVTAGPRPLSVNPPDTPQRPTSLVRALSQKRGKPIELKKSWVSDAQRRETTSSGKAIERPPVYSGPPHLFPGFADMRQPAALAASPDRKGSIHVEHLPNGSRVSPQSDLAQPGSHDALQPHWNDGLGRQMPANAEPITPARNAPRNRPARESESPTQIPAQNTFSSLPPRPHSPPAAPTKSSWPPGFQTNVQSDLGSVNFHIGNRRPNAEDPGLGSSATHQSFQIMDQRRQLRHLRQVTQQGQPMQQPAQLFQTPQGPMYSGGLPLTVHFAQAAADRLGSHAPLGRPFQQTGQQWTPQTQGLNVPAAPPAQLLPQPPHQQGIQPGINPAQDMYNFWQNGNDL